MKRMGLIIAGLGFFFFASAAQADWTPAKRLTWTSGSSYSPIMAIDSNNIIHVVWYEATPGKMVIFYKRSADLGTTWSSSKRLTWTSGSSSDPSLAIDANDTIHVVWQDATPGNAEIYYRRSMDGGSTWSAAKRLTWTYGESTYPKIAIGSSNAIHLAWQEETPDDDEIYYKGSSDGGSTWSAVKRLTWTSGESYEPAIAIDSNGHIHIIWYDSTPDHFEIYSKKSSDGGSTWSAAKRITWTSGGAMEAVIALDLSNALHVLWYGYPSGNAEISYKKSVDGGATWSAARRLTWTSGESFRPAIAIDPSNVIHVIWYDDTPGNTEIYYKRSTDGGTAWSAVKRLTWTSGDSVCPAIDANDTIHIVWYDDTPGNKEIYYKKGK